MTFRTRNQSRRRGRLPVAAIGRQASKQPRSAVGVGTLHLDFPSRMYTAPLRRGFPFLAYGEPNPRRAPFLRGFGIGKLNSIKTLGDPLVDGLRTLLPFRNRPGPRRSALHPAGDHNRGLHDFPACCWLALACSAGGDGGRRSPKNLTLIRRLRQPAIAR